MRPLVTVAALLALVAASSAQAPDAEAKQLAKYGADYAAAKKNLAAKPKDKRLRTAFVVAGDRYATATMTAAALPPKVKYRSALRLYREVLKVDPANREAKNNSEMIVSIYKSMHRPVPN